MPRFGEGLAAFAASGTSLVTHGRTNTWFATGAGATSRIFASNDGGTTWTVYTVPVAANAQSKGIFSIAFWSDAHGVAVGGDYAKPDTTAITVATTTDGGKTWTSSAPSPATGYLSGVTAIMDSKGGKSADNNRVHLNGVGTKGTAVSLDGGKSWALRDTVSLNTVAVVPGTRIVWAVGDRGKIVMRSDL